MEDDDLLPNESPYFGVPVEPPDQAIARKKEKAATLQAADEIRRVIKHLDDRIDYRSNIESINVNLAENPILHQKKCEVNDMLRLALIEEKQMLQELLDTHTK